jgi:hypothetical protein
MNEEERKLVECYEKLRSSNKLLFMGILTAAREMEENARRIARGLDDPGPLYADRQPALVGEMV